MIHNPDALRCWQRAIEGTLSKYLYGRYKEEMDVYMRFRQSTGPHCALCKGSARLMFKKEAVSNKSFLSDFVNNNWEKYI